MSIKIYLCRQTYVDKLLETRPSFEFIDTLLKCLTKHITSKLRATVSEVALACSKVTSIVKLLRFLKAQHPSILVSSRMSSQRGMAYKKSLCALVLSLPICPGSVWVSLYQFPKCDAKRRHSSPDERKMVRPPASKETATIL